MFAQPTVTLLANPKFPIIGGLRATVFAFLNEKLNLCPRSEATYVKVIIDPGQMPTSAVSQLVLSIADVAFDTHGTDSVIDQLKEAVRQKQTMDDLTPQLHTKLDELFELLNEIPEPAIANPNGTPTPDVPAILTETKETLNSLVEALRTILDENADQAADDLLSHYSHAWCPNCHGTGKVLRSRSCAEDDPPDPNDPTDYETCDYCHGLGLVELKDPKS